MKRIISIDFMRGTVMIIMALDHVRDLLHVDSITQSPTDLSTTTPSLFFTRWITHLCAPIFVFLAGTSAYISLQNKADTGQAAKGLWKRGLWLIILELSLVNFGIYFDLSFSNILIGVIAAIGFGFIVLGLLIRLPAKTIGIIGLSIILLHNLTPLIPFAEGSLLKKVLSPFFQPGVIPLTPRTLVIVGYPFIPWLGIMLTGYASGQFFLRPESDRQKLFLRLGIGLIVFFILLRYSNFYGDPAGWSTQKNLTYTILSFMNITKYPPSLLFCSVTLGIMFLKMSFSRQMKGRISAFIITYGKVPLFYFIIHFYLIHIVMICVMLIQGFNWSELDFTSGTFGRPKGQESGLTLPWIYLVWISVVMALYKPCQLFGKFKSTHNYWWLKYM